MDGRFGKEEFCKIGLGDKHESNQDGQHSPNKRQRYD